MDLSFGLFRKAGGNTPNAADRWRHDRSAIASWLQREAGGHFDNAEARADGSSYISFDSPLGKLSVHDYWSFCRPDFQSGQRAQSYADILGRQVPVLTLGYARPGAPDSGRAELIVFLHGEVVIRQGYSEAFAPLITGRAPGELIAIESTREPSAMKAVDLYADPFLVSVISTIRHQALKPPGSPVHP